MQRNLNSLLGSILDRNFNRVCNKKVPVGNRVNDVSIVRFQTLEKILSRHSLVIQANTHILRKLLESARLEATSSHSSKERQSNIVPVIVLAKLNRLLDLGLADFKTRSEERRVGKE